MSTINDKLDDAINRGDLEQVRELLAQGADIEYVDVFGNTPIMNAAWIASDELVNFLLSHGADVTHCNLEGKTALEMIKAVGHNEYGHDSIIQILESAQS